MKLCGVDGCERPIVVKGMCKKHNQRINKNGTTEITMREKGTGSINENGYKRTWDKTNNVFLHRKIAEQALGRKLPRSVIVHHVDGNPLNNENNNLVICENDAYHKLLHIRAEALACCGDANKRRCSICRNYDNVESLQKAGRRMYHKECYSKARKKKKEEEE